MHTQTNKQTQSTVIHCRLLYAPHQNDTSNKLACCTANNDSVQSGFAGCTFDPDDDVSTSGTTHHWPSSLLNPLTLSTVGQYLTLFMLALSPICITICHPVKMTQLLKTRPRIKFRNLHNRHVKMARAKGIWYNNEAKNFHFFMRWMMNAKIFTNKALMLKKYVIGCQLAVNMCLCPTLLSIQQR